jgi:hypothetical protein
MLNVQKVKVESAAQAGVALAFFPVSVEEQERPHPQPLSR